MDVQIYLFGGIRAQIGGVAAHLGRSNAGLLAYLVVAGPRLHPREALAELFWPELDPDAARRSLNTTVWRLRRLLEPHGVPRGAFLATSAQGELCLARSDRLWIDVEQFETAITAALTGKDPGLEALENALDLYRGDPLDGYYQDWALAARERLRSLCIEGLRLQMRRCARKNDMQSAIACGDRIVALDPVREDIHQELIRLHLRVGNRGQAARQLRQCEGALRTELGVAPHPVTRGLLTQSSSSPVVAGGGLAELQTLMSAMRGLMDAAEATIAALQARSVDTSLPQ